MAWHATACALIILVPVQIWIGRPVWKAEPPQQLLVGGLGLVYAVAVSIVAITGTRRATRAGAILATLLSGYYLALLLLAPEYSRGALLLASLLCCLFLTAWVALTRFRSLAVPASGMLLLALVAVVAVGLVQSPVEAAAGEADEPSTPENIASRIEAAAALELLGRPVPVWGTDQEIIRSVHHALHATYVQVDSVNFRGGGIVRIGEYVVGVTGYGAFFLLRPLESSFEVRWLRLRAPLNRREFVEDVPLEVDPDKFRVTGILARTTGDSVHILVSHQFWDADARCASLRVSTIAVERGSLVRDEVSGPWRRLYETRPCLPLKAKSHPFAGHQAGGRMAWVSDTTFLLTVGDYEFDGLASADPLPQRPDNDYGKTLIISFRSGEARLYSRGHRNPQGLFADESGRIWLTEHGPEGGDELNLLVRGGNYGWPYETYGTQYGELDWPLAPPPQVDTTEFHEPEFAWTPSVGVSALLVLRGSHFLHWRGDLLVSTLKTNQLLRMPRDEGRFAYVEPIAIDRRIRDLAETEDGRLVLWTDEGTVVLLQRAESDEGAVLFARCAGCHSVDDSSQTIGPDLKGVVGREIAAEPDFDYSGALRSLQGEWTTERLDAYLEDPQAFAPGTEMVFEGIEEPWIRESLIAYLRSLSDSSSP